MAWGTITLGRLTLREDYELDANLNAQTGRRTVNLKGQESNPPLTAAQVVQRFEDLLGLQDKFMPITFTDKAENNGWYVITDVNCTPTNYQGEVTKFDWSLTAERVGAEGEVDVDSRLVHIVRANDFSLTGERWHTPSAYAFGYYTGTNQPTGPIIRTGSDTGPMICYRGLAAGVSARWGSLFGLDGSPYSLSKCSILVDGVERSAKSISTLTTANWEINNKLVRVRPNGVSTSLEVAFWDGTTWDAVTWQLSDTAAYSANLIASSWTTATITRNDYEAVGIRFMRERGPGRTTLDLSLRRGARHVEGLLQTDIATTKAVWRGVAEAGTDATSYVRATANDAQGNRYVVGSARTSTRNTTLGGLTKSGSSFLDFYIGSAVGGSGAQAGDQPDNIRDQYIGAISEVTRGVRR